MEGDVECRPVPDPPSTHSRPVSLFGFKIVTGTRGRSWILRDGSAVWFPTPTLGGSQQPVPSVPGELAPSTGLLTDMVHRHTFIQ